MPDNSEIISPFGDEDLPENPPRFALEFQHNNLNYRVNRQDIINKPDTRFLILDQQSNDVGHIFGYTQPDNPKNIRIVGLKNTALESSPDDTTHKGVVTAALAQLLIQHLADALTFSPHLNPGGLATINKLGRDYADQLSLQQNSKQEWVITPKKS